MAAISTSLKTGANHNFGIFTKGHGGGLDRHHYSGPSGGTYHHYEHSSYKGKHKRSVAFSALTLLAFLFFLNILQNCIQDHITQMQTTTGIIVVTTAAPTALISRYREAEEKDFTNISRSDKNVETLTKRDRINNTHRKNKNFNAN